jgi:hypothetical protein
MKGPRNYGIRTTTICMTLALMGCGSDSTSPDSARPNSSTTRAVVPSSVVAVSAVSQSGWAGLNAIRGPIVQVLDQSGQPMANVTVSFAVTRGGGSVLSTSAKTTQDGVATTTWILGKQGGPNTVVASVGTLDGVSFQADATVPVIVARYDLEQVGGAPLPFQYSGDPKWLITGGHILIAADNSFAFGFDINGVSNLTPAGKVVRVDATTVNFVMSPDADEAGLFATGRMEGNTLMFTIDEFIVSQVQKYVLKN